MKDSKYVEMMEAIENAYREVHKTYHTDGSARLYELSHAALEKIQRLAKERPVTAADMLVILTQEVVTKADSSEHVRYILRAYDEVDPEGVAGAV